jgi:hypothetical protein
MKQTIIFFTSLFSILIISLTGCEKATNDMIMGSWKLVMLVITPDYQERDTIDYSNENIIYDFRKNGRLVITGNIPNDFYLFKDFQKGNHRYKFYYHDDCVSCPPNYFKIDGNRNYACSPPLWSTDLVISGEQTIEGTVFHWYKRFVKI